MLKDKEIERLAARFLDGATSPAEERQLYAYFSSPHVSPRWEAYRQMFMDYAALEQMDCDALGQMDDSALEPKDNAPEEQESARERASRMGRRVRLWHVAAGVAALALLLFGVVALLRLHEHRTLQRLYGGSYVIENGNRVDDLRLIQSRVRSTLAYAATVEQQVAADADMVKQAERDVVENIDDPQMRQTVMKILNE